jgi:hypothetical protein
VSSGERSVTFSAVPVSPATSGASCSTLGLTASSRTEPSDASRACPRGRSETAGGPAAGLRKDCEDSAVFGVGPCPATGRRAPTLRMRMSAPLRRVSALHVKSHCAAVLIGGVALVLGGCAGEGSESASAPRPSPTESSALPDPTVWPEQVAGARLVHGVVGGRGQSRIAATFTVGDTNLEWADVCDLPSVAPYVANGPLIMASVNGRLFNGTGCVTGDSTLSGTDMSHGEQAQTNRRGWEQLGVRPGDSVTVRAWLETASGKRITRPDVRLGFALYERTEPR